MKGNLAKFEWSAVAMMIETGSARTKQSSPNPI